MFKSAFLGFALLMGALPVPLAGQEKQSPKELTQYVRDAKKAGLKETQIKQNAVQAGWTEQDIKSAIDSLNEKPSAGAPLSAKPAADEPVNGTAPISTAPIPTAAPVMETPTPAASGPTAASPNGPTGTTTVKETPTLPATAPSTPPSASGVTTGGILKPDVVNRGVPDEYHIGEGDILQVNVWGEPTASVSSVVVRPDGKITIPLVKDISVAGLTPADAEKAITDQLVRQIKAPDVTVIVNQINSKKIFVVGGGVKKEGPINFTYRMTVMQALSEAGGLTDYAKRKKIYVLRNENGRQYQLKFDYDAVLKGEHMETNIPMIAGDTLVVPNH